MFEIGDIVYYIERKKKKPIGLVVSLNDRYATIELYKEKGFFSFGLSEKGDSCYAVSVASLAWKLMSEEQCRFLYVINDTYYFSINGVIYDFNISYYYVKEKRRIFKSMQEKYK